MKKTLLIINILFVFSSLFSQTLDYDYPEGAISLPHQDNWTSGIEAYTTVGATNQGVAGDCNSGRNRWFYFDAVTEYISLGLVGGTNIVGDPTTFLQMTIFKGASLNETIACNNASSNSSITFETNSLVVGERYYVSVISGNNASKGSFGFEIETQIDYDYPEGAISLPHQDNWTSGIEAYTTVGATNQGVAGDCNSGRNRWFYFDAASENIALKLIGGTNTSSNPTTFLQMTIFRGAGLNETIACNNASSNSSVTFESNSLIIGDRYYVSVISGNAASTGSFGFEISGGPEIPLWTFSSNTLHPFNSEHKIGIGTSDTKGYKLAVSGNIISEEIKVALIENWPDFVFQEDYELQTLEEIEQYIIEKSHLPEIPSEAEVTENGINLGEMDAKLLQKIEELTLYMIDLNKEIKQLKSENQELKEKVNRLETK